MKRPRLLAGIAALGTGLLLRIFFLVRFPRVAGDPMIYMEYARTLLEQHVYGYTRMVGGVLKAYPSLVRLPGYPLFLAGIFALFGHANVKAVLYVQALVDLGTCVLAALTAARIFGERAGWFALWLGVLCPFTATYVAAPLTETMVLFTVAAAFYALVRWRADKRTVWLVVLGAALGYSILLRPDQGLLPLAVVPAVLWASGGRGLRRLGPAVLVSVLTLLPLVPWTARNWHTLHVFQPLAPRSAADPGELIPDGFNRWYRTWGVDFATNETAYWAYNNDPILMENLPARAFDSAAQRRTTEALLEEYSLTTTETPAFDARFAALAEQRIRGHRMRYFVWLPAARVADMLFRPRTELLPVYDDWWKPHRRGTATVVSAGVYFVLNLVYFGLGWMGFWRRGRLEPVVWSMAAYVVLRLALLATLDNAEPRYTLEFFPLLFVLGGAWLGRARGTAYSSRLQGSVNFPQADFAGLISDPASPHR